MSNPTKSTSSKKISINSTKNLNKLSLKYTESDIYSHIGSLKSSICSYDLFRSIYEETESINIFESFYVLFLSRTNKVLGYTLLSQGGYHCTVVDLKILFSITLLSKASSIILCHNHPSGILIPSNEDIKLTSKIKEAGKLLDITVLDHIIISSKNYYSFADDGIL